MALRGVVTAGLTVVVAAAVVSAQQLSVPAAPVPRLTADVAPVTASVPVIDRVGPLFLSGLGSAHSCSASVVSSTTGDVIATAAHCVSGTGAGAIFAPGYADGSTPHGTWVVTATYVPSRWTADQDPQADVALLTVAPSSGNPSDAPVQSVVGGNPLGTTPPAGTTVQLSGYAAGLDDSAITCTAPTTATGAYATLTCGSFPGGTSGGPWISAGRLVGVIGGLHQGGCTDATSYTSTLTAATTQLLERAESGGTGDHLPVAGPSGCG